MHSDGTTVTATHWIDRSSQNDAADRAGAYALMGAHHRGIRHRKCLPIIKGGSRTPDAQWVSLTGGVPGAHVTYDSKGYPTTSADAPDTGLSYRTKRCTGQPSTSGLEILAALFEALFLPMLYLIIGAILAILAMPLLG